jgi:hypothetical protein
MIIRETATHFTMITQNDHAHLAADMAAYLKPSLYLNSEYASDVLLAIREHDRCWIKLDAMPIWNDQSHAPFGFDDYPIQPKMMFYRFGIDEIQEMSAYASYLSSVHFASFQPIRESDLPECVEFVRYEKKRQASIQNQIQMPEQDVIQRHSQLLKCCDDLSLYVSLNEPGVSKKEEHPWFRDGFDVTLDREERMIAHWVNERVVQVAPFPYVHEFSVSMKLKHVSKEAVQKSGIDRAYHDTAWTEQTFHFIGEKG